jgi:uncharacterized protein YcfL
LVAASFRINPDKSEDFLTLTLVNRKIKQYSTVSKQIVTMRTHFLKVFLLSVLSIRLFLFGNTPSALAVTYSNGTYINLCGSGTAATTHSCNQGCNINTGSCSASGNVVVKYTCDGRVADCRQNESGFSSSHAIGSVACGKTVQIDVFSKNCRTNGQWTCGDQDLKDYIVWYSGDCQQSENKTSVVNRFLPSIRTAASPTPLPTPTPTPTAAPSTPHQSRCEDLSVVSGNDATVPATVTIRARATDNRGDIQEYKYYFGDGSQEQTSNPEVQHRYETSGSFLARVDIKDSQGNWKTSSSCETNVRVKASPVESHKSDCSDIRINMSNSGQAPSTVEYRVSGYDNKGDLQGYRIQTDNQDTLESSTATMTHTISRAGTYTVRAYVKDSQGNWVGGDDGCRRTVYVNTEPLTEQPATGTPTLFSVLGLTSGLSGVGLHLLRKKLES